MVTYTPPRSSDPSVDSSSPDKTPRSFQCLRAVLLPAPTLLLLGFARCRRCDRQFPQSICLRAMEPLELPCEVRTRRYSLPFLGTAFPLRIRGYKSSPRYSPRARQPGVLLRCLRRKRNLLSVSHPRILSEAFRPSPNG